MLVENLPHTKGEYVVYKKQGIYLIDDVRQDNICGVKKYFYVLKSVYDVNATVYVPTDSEALVSRLEKVLKPDDIEKIIEKSKSTEIEWQQETSVRQEMFAEILSRSNLSEIISLVKLLKQRKMQFLSNKKHFPAIDERALNCARKIIEEAFAFSLGLDKNDVMDYVEKKTN